ncbi:carbohydrate-binding family 9-like protein [Pelagicoccus albus]|uniref:Carbohydrate-binding family 9-like protein n=2 Tax=Pelagicoccus albus TaxID=415222 RepID=A0A7X1BAR5_9BACT|nr:carbohydrate-binding family 9-like protein [Pelagicoccus albus]
MADIEPATYQCLKATEPVVIDGKLDDAAWRNAEWTSDFVDIEGDAKPRPRFQTKAKMAWDDNYLYVSAILYEPDVWGTLTEHDSVIFQDNDFEVFIDPDSDNHGYFEFEINALNTFWDLTLPKPYMDMGSADNSWEIRGIKTAVSVQGTLNDPSDEDRSWIVEMAFPWEAYGDTGVPEEGDFWRINFSRVQWQSTVREGSYQKVPGTHEDNWVWSPQGVVDMHRPEMWGYLVFGSEVAIDAIQSRGSRDAMYSVYYAQRDYYAKHEKWAKTLKKLGLKRLEGQVDLNASKSGYKASVTDASGTWTIDHVRHVEGPDRN